MAYIKLIKDGDENNPLILSDPWMIYNVEGFGYPDIEFETESYAFDDGSYWTGNQATKRVISFSCINKEKDVNYQKREMVGQFVNHLSEYSLIFELDDRSAYLEGKITDFQMPVQKKNALVRFDMEFTSINPFLQSVDDFGNDLNAVVNKIHYPIHYSSNDSTASVPYSVREYSSSVTVENDGIVDTGFVATIEFMEATGTFGLYNTTTAKSFFITKSFSAGDILVIDTLKKKCYLNGSAFYAGISASSEFWKLQKGSNIVTYTAQYGQSTLEINISYRSQRLVF